MLVCLPLSAAAQNLNLTLAEAPAVSGEVSTRDDDGLTLSVISGQRVSFARSSGRDYQLQAGAGLFWSQVQEVPRDADAIALTPVVLEDGSVEVLVEVSRKSADRQQRYISTLLAQSGEWLRLLGPAAQPSRDTKVYGTQSLTEDSLYLLVEPR
jgi:hypothetical protein